MAQHPASMVLRSTLVHFSLATDPSSSPVGVWPCYVSNEPNTPDNCITIYDTAFTDDGRVNIDGELQYHEGLQIRVRSVDYLTGWQKMDAIRTAISMSVSYLVVAVEGENYLVICYAKIGNILPIGTEQTSKRQLFTLNLVSSVTKL